MCETEALNFVTDKYACTEYSAIPCHQHCTSCDTFMAVSIHKIMYEVINCVFITSWLCDAHLHIIPVMWQVSAAWNYLPEKPGLCFLIYQINSLNNSTYVMVHT